MLGSRRKKAIFIYLSFSEELIEPYLGTIMINVGGAAVSMTPRGSSSMGYDSQGSHVAGGKPNCSTTDKPAQSSQQSKKEVLQSISLHKLQNWGTQRLCQLDQDHGEVQHTISGLSPFTVPPRMPRSTLPHVMNKGTTRTEERPSSQFSIAAHRFRVVRFLCCLSTKTEATKIIKACGVMYLAKLKATFLSQLPPE